MTGRTGGSGGTASSACSFGCVSARLCPAARGATITTFRQRCLHTRRRRSAMDAEVLVAGHVCVDLAPRFEREARIQPGALFDVGALDVRVGGCIANTGATLAGLGTAVRAHGLVGDDALGGIIAAELDAVPGVQAELDVAPDRATSYSIVIQPPGEDR